MMTRQRSKNCRQQGGSRTRNWRLYRNALRSSVPRIKRHFVARRNCKMRWVGREEEGREGGRGWCKEGG